MPQRRRLDWMALAVPLLVCLPCVLTSLLAFGGAGVLSTIMGVTTGHWRFAGTDALVAPPAHRRRSRQTRPRHPERPCHDHTTAPDRAAANRAGLGHAGRTSP
jgi:hypothetical protein